MFPLPRVEQTVRIRIERLLEGDFEDVRFEVVVVGNNRWIIGFKDQEVVFRVVNQRSVGPAVERKVGLVETAEFTGWHVVKVIFGKSIGVTVRKWLKSKIT